MRFHPMTVNIFADRLQSSVAPASLPVGTAKMKQAKIGAGFGLWRLGMPPPEDVAHVAEEA